MKEPDWSKYPNFSREEFVCSCGCNQAFMKPEYMDFIQRLRYRIGPIRITSGYRCPNHPEEQKKTLPGSHSNGTASDNIPLECGKYEFIKEAMDLGAIGIGVANTFIHTDIEHPHAGRPALWKY